ncbi:MAG: SpoIIE family protein phosphatase [Phycisphaerae bacterium]|jgi:sigma-B regulation protein RsbU (phosphoserine phosphatase)
MNSAAQLLVFDAAPEQAQALCRRLARQGCSAECLALAAANENLGSSRPDLAVIVAGSGMDEPAGERAAKLVEKLSEGKIPTVVWGQSDNSKDLSGPLVQWLDPTVTLDEVVGRLTTLAHYAPLVRQLERELDHVHRLGGQLNRYFSEIDQEMRLAGQLQRDFLPAKLPDVSNVRFAALYRPASWVSGDMYDAFRIDEDHVGVFIADAMGHGVAAGLLTMFLRHALLPKQIERDSYRVVKPTEAMTDLHECLVRQRLPHCQFVTAAYGVYCAPERELRLARGGHPHPLLVRTDGTIEPIMVGGSLLGLPDLPAEFEEVRLKLTPGEKVIFFTDGLEDDFFVPTKQGANPQELAPRLREWAKHGAHALVERVTEYLDTKEGSLHPADDVTLLVLEAS